MQTILFYVNFYISFFSFKPTLFPQPTKALSALPVQYWDSLEQSKFVCLCLFVSLFVFTHISLHSLPMCFLDW